MHQPKLDEVVRLALEISDAQARLEFIAQAANSDVEFQQAVQNRLAELETSEPNGDQHDNTLSDFVSNYETDSPQPDQRPLLESATIVVTGETNKRLVR